MTVTSTVRDVIYTGTGTTGPFPVPFYVPDPSDLVVQQTDAGGAPYTLVPPAYGVAGGTTTSQVTLATALPSTSTINIQRIVPLVQQTAFTNQGGYFPDVIEQALDLLTMACQQLDAGVQNLAPRVAALETFEAGVASFEASVTALQNRATADEATISSQGTQLANVGTQANANSTAIQQQASTIAALQAQLSTANSAIMALQTRATADEANIASLIQQINALAATVNQNTVALSRAILAPSGDTTLGTLPAASTRANNLLGFSSTGALALYAQDAPGA